MKFGSQELVDAFEGVEQLRREFPVNNPSASLADMQRQLRGEHGKFICYGGYKSFHVEVGKGGMRNTVLSLTPGTTALPQSRATEARATIRSSTDGERLRTDN